MKKIVSKTELLFKKSKPIDKLSVSEGINLMLKEQKNATTEVKKSLETIEIAINEIFNHLKTHNNGRIIYVGAGTSGRIGIQDGAELYPTFNWPKDRFDYIIAGGKKAIINAIENAEDNTELAKKVLIKKKISSKDVVIGLAASGNTPYTCKIMEGANIKKALTISISNNPNGEILKYGKIKIILDTKEEIVAGSTRLKAGTAQKICLNIISTLVMTKLGKVKNGLMSEMVPTNEKLRKRKVKIEKNI